MKPYLEAGTPDQPYVMLTYILHGDLGDFKFEVKVWGYLGMLWL